MVDLIHQIYFYGIRQMGMKDRSLIDKINPTFIALTMTAILHYLLAWKTGKFRVPPDVGPAGGVQRTCDASDINHGVNNACIDVFRHLDMDFHSA
jgi:hypothetical protein